MLEIIIVILFVISAVESFIIYRKVLQANKYQEVLEVYETWIEEFTLAIEAIDGELDRIDSEGIFRSDDEVGFFYQAMYSILKRLNTFGLTDEPVQIPGTLNEETDPEFYSHNKELVRRITKRRQDISIEAIIEQKKSINDEIKKTKEHAKRHEANESQAETP